MVAERDRRCFENQPCARGDLRGPRSIPFLLTVGAVCVLRPRLRSHESSERLFLVSLLFELRADAGEPVSFPGRPCGQTARSTKALHRCATRATGHAVRRRWKGEQSAPIEESRTATVDDKMRPKTERGGQDCVGRFGTACAQFALGSVRPDEGSRPSTGRSHILPADDVVDGQRGAVATSILPSDDWLGNGVIWDLQAVTRAPKRPAVVKSTRCCSDSAGHGCAGEYSATCFMSARPDDHTGTEVWWPG